MNYEEKNETIEIPIGTGVEGFLRALREILQLGRIQEVHIDARGKISYKRFAREGETPQPLDLDFESLMPYAIVRNGYVEEVIPSTTNAAVVLGQLFARAAADHVYPVAWVAGANTTFWSWLTKSTGLAGSVRDELYGLPFLQDHMLEDSVLLLCAAYGRRAAISDTQRSYKILMPEVP